MTKLTAALIAALMGLAACGGEGTPPETEPPADTTTTTTTTTVPPETTAPATDGPAATISIAGFSFGAPVQVAVGDVVAVVNNDDVPHTWTADDGSFSLSLGPGERGTHTFNEPGEFTFFCSIHAGMEGVITVTG